MTLYALLFTLSCIGISETAYLIKKRRSSQEPVCFIGKECYKVLGSKYSKILLFHNDTWGLLFYIFISTLTAFLVVGLEPILWWEILANISIAAASVVSAILIYLQWRVIRAWCFWCVLSALTILGMGIILVLFEIA